MEELSPLQLEDLYKQAAVSLGYPNLKKEQKRVVTSFFLGELKTFPQPMQKTSMPIHVLRFHHYVIVADRAGVNIPCATDTSWVY